MMKSWKLVVASVLLMCATLPAQQNKPVVPGQPYKLTFVISEVEDGKKINQRTYSMLLLSDDKRNVLKTGSRLPVMTMGVAADNSKTQAWQYLDVGVNIDAKLSPGENDLLNLDGRIDISSVFQVQQMGNSGGQPIIRQNLQDMHAVIHPEKPTVIASLDDVSSTRTVQIEVTATRVK